MTEHVTPKTIDWNNLGFNYIETDYSYRAYYKNGQWGPGELVKDKTVTIHEGSTVLHYGQHVFEGMKAYRTKEGNIQLFRPDMNAKRMIDSCERIMMPAFPEERFIEAVKQVVRANEDWVPPYDSGGTLYIRPYMVGIGENIGVKPASEYLFGIFVLPVGSYFSGGLKPSNFIVSEYDRAAPKGTGAAKAGGNYGASLLPGSKAKQAGFSDAVYLDPKTHTKIEEVGAANFFGITKDNTFITPQSPSILPSITKKSLLYLAENHFGLDVVEGDVYVTELDQFKEAGAMGTAAVIAPIGGLHYNGRLHVFYSEDEVGPVTKKLYDELIGIQFGDRPAPEGWIVSI